MKKNKLNIPIKIIIGFVLIAGLGLYCNSVLKNWDIEQNLGSNYILCADGEIIYQPSDEKPAEYIIPFGTARYGFDERWIVVETKTRTGFHQTLPQDTIAGEASNYWIIDKSIPVETDNPSTFEDIYYQGNTYSVIRKSLIGPLDSLSFEKEKQKRGIRVKFEKIKK